jgi:hypothetical protein
MTQQRIVLNGKQLNHSDSAVLCNIKKGTVVHLLLRLRGGMYHETSGKNGNYGDLKEIVFEIAADLIVEQVA